MRVGIIDCGTNTFNLIVAEFINDDTFNIIHKEKKAVKLGEGGIQNRTIIPKAFERGIIALKEYNDSIKEFETDKTLAFATAAIRSAANGSEFVEAAKKETGIEIKVISGDREAELIYKGVNLAVGFHEKSSLIMDVGGGSTEFIIANKKEVLWKHSFDIGVARLIEHIHPSDPIKENEIKKIEAYLEKKLLPLFDALKKFSCDNMIGCSGSFETFASIILHQKNNLNQLENSYKFDFNDLLNLHNQLLTSSELERLKIQGLPESRVDSIVLASIYVNYLIKVLNIKELKLSLYAIKEGIASELAF